MKVAICFYGVIGRSLKYTIKHIQENIFDVLKQNNIDFDTFVHNNITETLSCTTKNCYNTIYENAKIDNTLYHNLQPLYYSETYQSLFDSEYNWEIVFKNGDIHNNNFESVKNSIRQLHSIQQVTKLWQDKNKYDLYIYLRPDLLYINKLDIELINKYLKNDVFFTPNWDTHGGLNDRVYFGNYDIMTKIGNRIDLITQLIGETDTKYNAEHYMKAVVDFYKIDTIPIYLRGLRVRANGVIVETNTQL